jgi:hypothetical protein
VPGALVTGQQFDVQVRRVPGQFRPDHPLRPVQQRDHLLLRAARRIGRLGVPGGHPREPLGAQQARERHRVGGADHVADRPLPVVQHERQLRLEVDVRPGEQVLHQVVGRPPAHPETV